VSRRGRPVSLLQRPGKNARRSIDGGRKWPHQSAASSNCCDIDWAPGFFRKSDYRHPRTAAVIHPAGSRCGRHQAVCNRLAFLFSATSALYRTESVYFFSTGHFRVIAARYARFDLFSCFRTIAQTRWQNYT